MPRLIGSLPDKKDSIEMVVWGSLYKADSIRKYNLKFPSERELISEDLVFNIDYMQHANGVCTISDTGYNYRLNINSLSTKYRVDRFESSRYFYMAMKEKMSELGYSEPTYLRLRRMFFIYLRMCISQENKRISGLSPYIGIKNINKICYDAIVQEAIKEYPIIKLGIKQMLFLKMIQLKADLLLYFIAQSGKI